MSDQPMMDETRIFRLLITTIDQSVEPVQKINYGEMVEVIRKDPDGFLMIRSLDGERTVPCRPEELETLSAWNRQRKE